MTFKAVFETLPLVELPEYKGLRGEGRGGDGRRTRTWTRRSTGCARRPPATTPSRAAPPGRATSSCSTSPGAPEDGGKGRPRRERAHRGRARTGNHEDLNAGPRGHVRRGDEGHRRSPTPRTTAPASLAGKTVAYTVTLKGVKNKVVPAADDEFAKDLGEFGSLAELARQDPRAAPGRRASAGSTARSRSALVEALVAARSLRGAGGPRRAPHDRRAPRTRPAAWPCRASTPPRSGWTGSSTARRSARSR